MDTPDYETNPRGHIWRQNANGTADRFGLDVEDEYTGHNGPRCVLCDYAFCSHCQKGPDEDCPGVVE